MHFLPRFSVKKKLAYKFVFPESYFSITDWVFFIFLFFIFYFYFFCYRVDVVHTREQL